MNINFVRLCDFRNIELSEALFSSKSVWIHGQNAQGKTNLLEALGLLCALRSFRTSKTAALIKKSKPCAKLLFRLSHEVLGECEVILELGEKTKKIFVNDVECKSLAEFIGEFPVLAVCSDDIKLVRGGPAERRKFVDMLISSLDADYFRHLKLYHAALNQRNALLKQSNFDEVLMGVLEAQMAEAAVSINALRDKYLKSLGSLTTKKYKILSSDRESAAVVFKSAQLNLSCSEYLSLLKSSRERDALLGSTSIGPHRDDFLILVAGAGAKEFASEGQQRSIVLSLKLAQYEMAKLAKNIVPVLLCDDILGELDSDRREAFWSCIDRDCQVFASSTSPAPESYALRESWQSIEVKSGSFYL